MLRENQLELLEFDDVPDNLVERAYKDLARIHNWLGDTSFIVNTLRRDALPCRQVLDVGCGTGLVAEQVGRRLGATVIGIDSRRFHSIRATVPILQKNALQDPLPDADVAFSMHLGHHLSETDLEQLILNVGRSCRRFVLLDLVRHWLPLTLFRIFVAPLVCPIDAEDGQRSIRRSYMPTELRRITASALAGTGSTFHLHVARFYNRQVIDISYDTAGIRRKLETRESAGEVNAY